MSAKSHYTLTPSGSASRGVSETSIAAYESQDPDVKARREQQILAYIEGNGDATCWEVERDLTLLRQSASSTITRLRNAGHLLDTGERRPTNTGRMAIVWGPAS
jgi:hypothetical protein